MSWIWRGDVMPATRSEFQQLKLQLETERFPPLEPGGERRAFHQLNKYVCVALMYVGGCVSVPDSDWTETNGVVFLFFCQFIMENGQVV